VLLFVELVAAGVAAAAGAGELSFVEELAESEVDVEVEVVLFESVEDLESPVDLGLALP
jgi:hypothetical protein